MCQQRIDPNITIIIDDERNDPTSTSNPNQAQSRPNTETIEVVPLCSPPKRTKFSTTVQPRGTLLT